MTKAEAIKRTASLTRLDRYQTASIVLGLIDEIMAAVEKGEVVFISGFGTFRQKWRNETTGRHINKNILITVEPCYIPCYSPSRDFEDQVKKNLA